MDAKIDIDKVNEQFITAQRGQIYEKVIGYVEKQIIENAVSQAEQKSLFDRAKRKAQRIVQRSLSSYF